MKTADSPITTDAELEATLDRIRHFQSQLVRLRQVETDPEAYQLVQVHDDRAIFQATDRRVARVRHPQPLTGVGREASKPRERLTGTPSAQTPEKRYRRGCGAFRDVRSGRPGHSSRGSRVAHQPEDRCGGAIDQAILPPSPFMHKV